MTTIAYRDGVLASDSLVTDDQGGTTYRVGDCVKVFTLSSGALYGSCGDDDDRSLRALLDNVARGEDMPKREELSELKGSGIEAIVILPDGSEWQVSIEDKEGGAIPLHAPFMAIGSGRKYALAAMACGKSAEEAIEIAARFDVYTGLPVQALRTPLRRAA